MQEPPSVKEAALSDPKPGLTPDRREKTYATFLDWIESIDVALARWQLRKELDHG
jgi:hypothetical protein